MQGSRANLSPRELKIYSNFLFLWAGKIWTDYGVTTLNIGNNPHFNNNVKEGKNKGYLS